MRLLGLAPPHVMDKYPSKAKTKSLQIRGAPRRSSTRAWTPCFYREVQA